MQLLFGFQETLEVVTNDAYELSQNEINSQRVTHKDAKKKYYKVAFCIQSAVDVTCFDQISHAESEKEACDILVKYY